MDYPQTPAPDAAPRAPVTDLSAKHTPGPWTAKKFALEDGFAVFWPDRSKSGVHYRRVDDRGGFGEADARLIAAAPDLLSILKRAVVEHGPLGDDSRPAWWDDACTAIAKATEYRP